MSALGAFKKLQLTWAKKSQITTYNSLLCMSSMMSLNSTSLFLSQKPLTS